MANIDVISSCLVGMASKGFSNPSSKIDLTPWDLQFLLLDPIQKGILFHEPQELGENIINHLKTSLSRALDFFPPLAGRLATIKNTDNTISYFIDCNNAGVEFTHAVAGALSMSDITKPTYIPKVVSSLFPLNGLLNCEGVSNPLLGIQVTRLMDGYFIGCTANHSVVDGTSFWHFFNSWSEISQGLDTISKAPIFERWFPSNINNDRLIHIPPLQFEQNLLVPPPLLERVFHFSKESLSKLKSRANSEAATDKISTLQALSAHLWRSVTRCRSQQSNPDQKNQEVKIIIIVGARARIPLPDGYFGNAVHSAGTTVSEQELLSHGPGYAALKINELINQQTKEATRKFVEDWVDNPVVVTKGKYNFVMSSSPRHNVYGCDFGWGKPIAVRSGKGQKSDGKMTVFPGAGPEGGIDVEICLAPETLQAVEEDEEFLEPFTICK